MGKDINWPESADRQEVRSKSPFVRGVEDFARYQYKEYIEESDDRALLICAVDRSVDDDHSASACIALGRKAEIADGLSDMMRMDGLKQAFRVAALKSCLEDEDDLAGMIALQRRKLRKMWAIFAATCLWAVLTVALAVLGYIEWYLAVTNMILIVTAMVMIWTDTGRIRLLIGRLERQLRDESRERARMRRRALDGMLEELGRAARAMRDDEDEDDDEP